MKKTASFISPHLRKRWLKTLLIMKFTAFLILITALQVSAKTYSQERVSVDFNHTNLSKALKTIERESSYRFVFSNDVLSDKLKVTIKAKDILVKDLLAQMLTNTDLVYTEMENNLVGIKYSDAYYADKIVVKGIVTDDKGNPLANVSVTAGKGTGTTTDDKGEYSISVDENGSLTFSFVGFTSQTIKVDKRDVINVVLAVSNDKLSDVVVVAYGTTTKRANTAAIKALDMKNVAPIPVASISDALAGRVPGIIITASTGAPGAKSQISIRGGNTPLFVIDNIARSQNDFENLNPNDIASISILQDAAATALYGANGGNGVVLVTTKKGAAGKLNVEYSFNEIGTELTVNPPKLSSYDNAVAVNKVYMAEGLTPPTPDSVLAYYKNQTKPFIYPNTDWKALTLKKMTPEQRHDLSVSGGNEKLAFYSGLSYYDQGTILKTPNNYNKRITYRLSTTSNLENIHLKIITSLDGFTEKNETPSDGFFAIFSHIQNHGPAGLAYNMFGLPYNTIDNPVDELSPLSGYNRSNSRILNGRLFLDWGAPFLDGLHFKFNGNYNQYDADGKSWNFLAPTYLVDSKTAIYGSAPNLSASAGSGNTLTLQGYITYDKTFGKHKIDFNGIYETVKSNSTSLSASRQQYQILFDQFVAGPTLNQLAGGSEAESAHSGYIGSLSYGYNNRYFITGTARYDGNDLLPPGKQWGWFPAVSASWIFSDENFMHFLKQKHIFDYLKFRASYGVVGTLDNITSFQYVPGYSIDANTWVINGQQVQGTSEPGSIPSTNYSWYNIRSRDAGLDFGSLNNRLTGSFDWYYTRTTGYVISNTRYSATLGIGLPPINSNGALRKEGYDFNVTWKDHTGAFNYSVGFNYGRFNQLWEIYPGESADLSTYQNPFTRTSGTSTAGYGTGYINEGFYQNNSDLLNGPRRIASINTVAGDLKYQDTNGDGKIDGNDFRRIGTNTFPRSNYGFTFDMSYKGFFMTGVVQGSGNRDRYLGDVIQGGSIQAKLVYGFQENYWTPTNTSALYPRQVSSPGVNGNNNYTTSDFWLLKSGYIRLKYLQFGYDFKSGLLKKSNVISSLKAFVSGTNLLTKAKSLDYFIDPESDTNNYDYPIVRSFSVGFNVGF